MSRPAESPERSSLTGSAANHRTLPEFRSRRTSPTGFFGFSAVSCLRFPQIGCRRSRPREAEQGTRQIRRQLFTDSIETTRSPPTRERSSTISACAATTVPITAAFRPIGCTHFGQNPLRSFRRNDCDQFPSFATYSGSRPSISPPREPPCKRRSLAFLPVPRPPQTPPPVR